MTSEEVAILEVVSTVVAERLASTDTGQRAAIEEVREEVREELRLCRRQIEALPSAPAPDRPAPVVHFDLGAVVGAIERAAEAQPDNAGMQAVAEAIAGISSLIGAQTSTLERLCETIQELVDRPLPPLRKFRIIHGYEQSVINEE
jgi:hypothetical protein